MHIGFLIGTDSWGGLEMNQVKSALWIQEYGVKVSILSTGNKRVEAFCAKHGLNLVSIDSHKKYYDFKASKKLRSLIKAYNIEHLIIRDVRDMSTAALARFWSKKSFRLHYFMEMQLGVTKKNLLHTLRFKQLDSWSCPLNWLQRQVQEMTNMKADRIIYIPSPMDLVPFRNNITKSEARKTLNLPENKFIIGLAGRFDPQKGQILLLEALKMNPSREIHILFLGEPTANEGTAYFDNMNEYLNDPHFDGRVHIRPFRNDIQLFYKAIDAFIMASKAETVGMVTLEALASSCPVIGSNAGGTPEILGDGKRGYLFEPLNPKSLNEAINELYNSPKSLNWQEIENYIAQFDYHHVMPLVKNRLDIFKKVP